MATFETFLVDGRGAREGRRRGEGARRLRREFLLYFMDLRGELLERFAEGDLRDRIL